jgi:uncharacterized membrane protein
MKCPNCQRDNSPNNRFCIYCGAILEQSKIDDSGTGQDAEETSPEQSSVLINEIKRLERLVSLMNERLLALERGTRPSVPPPEPVKAQPPEPAKEPEPAAAAVQRAKPETVVWEPPPEKEEPEEVKERDWEQVFGGRWLARIGAFALIIAAGFFLAYAFNNNWIGPTGQVIIGVVVGLGLLGGGYYWRAKYPVLAQAINGGGIGILYLSIFAAFAAYGLIHFYLAFGLLILVCVASALLSLRYNSMALAIIGILGAFIAPSMISVSASGTGGAVQVGQSIWLLVYIFAVDIGVLVLSALRNWRWMTLLALIGSFSVFGIWQGQFGREVGMLASMLVLTVIYFIFTGATLLYSMVWKRPTGKLDQLLIAVNVVVYFIADCGLLAQSSHAAPIANEYSFWLLVYIFVVDISVLVLSTFRDWRWFTLLALLGSLSAFGVWYINFGGEIGLAASMIGLTVIFLIFAGATTVFNIIWKQPAEPLDLALMTTNAATYFGISYALMWSDLRVWMGGFSLLLALLYGFAAYMMLKRGEENKNLGLFSVGIAILFFTIAIPVQIGDLSWTTIAWAAEGAVLVFLSFSLQMPTLRYYGYAVSVFTALRLMFFDQIVDLRNYMPVINERFLAFSVSIAAFYYVGYLLRKKREALLEWETAALKIYPFFFVAANFYTVWLFSAEVIHYFNTSLALTLVWTIYAVLLLVVGLLRQWRVVRIWALALLAIPILKVFIYDVFTLQTVYRIIAFTVLGVLLIASGYLYNRYNESIKEFITKK